jgi:AraC family transcriptional regulator
LEHRNDKRFPGAWQWQLLQNRRIEVMSGDLRLPAVNLDPVLSSAGVGWEGFLLEEHDSITPPLVDAPEHFSAKHILRLNTGGGSMSNWRIDGRKQRTQDQPRAVSILPAGTHVSVVTHRTSCLVLEIDPLQLQQGAAPSGGGDLELPVKLTIPDRNIELLMTAMQADLEAGSPTGPLYGESLGNALGIYLIQRFGVFAPKFEPYKGGLPKPRLNRVREYIEHNLANNISLTALAEVAGLSLYHFAKAFKQSTGATPHQYLLTRKIDRAKELLNDPKRSVLEASARTGFVDQSHFTKTFRRLVGVTPTEFRNQT